MRVKYIARMNSTNAIAKGLPIWVALLACLGWMSLENHAVAQPAEFEFSPTNSSGTFYGQATVNGVPANGNDWVAAFDMAGNCAGAAQIVLNDGLARGRVPDYRPPKEDP